MSTETTQFINVEQPVAIEGEEIRETIEEITGNEPDITDHIGGNGAAGTLENNASPETTSGDNGNPEGKSKTRTKSEESEEEFKRIVRETIEEITPLYEQAVELAQEQRDRYREIGLIVIKKREEVSGSYGSKLIDELAEHFGVGQWALRAMADYAKVDPHGEAIPPALIALSWRRVVLCAQRTKTKDQFSAFLQGHPQLITMSWEELNQLLRTEFPKKDTRGRKRNNRGTPLNTTDAENEANSLGGGGGTDPLPVPPKSESAKLPPRVEQAFSDLVSAEDSPWKGEVNVYAGEGCFAFQATFKTEAECVTVFKHFITYLEKEAA